MPSGLKVLYPTDGYPLLEGKDFYMAIDTTNVASKVNGYYVINNGDTLQQSNIIVPELPVQGLSKGKQTITLSLKENNECIKSLSVWYNVLSLGNITGVAADKTKNSLHDVEEKSPNSFDVEGDIDLGEKICVFRFSNIHLPQGANIDSAYIQFHSEKANQQSSMNLLIMVN
ncbi:MAG: hypothetical protein HC896_09760 [Bacteroidales bacterium]|nr:hypothetical protein [Bacteroidales bacterium]